MDRRFALLVIVLSVVTFATIWLWPTGQALAPRPPVEAAAEGAGCKDGTSPSCEPRHADPIPVQIEAPPPTFAPAPSGYTPKPPGPHRLG